MGYGQYSYNSFNPRTLADFRGYRHGAYTRDGTDKRVKASFTIDQVIHVWAQRTQTFGKSGKGNVYFEGDRLFDYGDHFCMGQFVTNARGELACFLNSDSYGPTTSYHQNITERAIPPGILIFRIPGAGYNRRASDNGIDVPAILESFNKRALAATVTSKRARSDYSKNYNAENAERYLAEAEKFAAFFDAPYARPDMGALIQIDAETKARAKAEEKRRADARRAESLEHFQKWQAGANTYCPQEWQRDEKGGVRMRIKGDMLQTAMGAEVPLSHATRVFRFIKKCRAENKDWHKNGTMIRVGHFQVDSIKANGDFHAGCHFFTWAQVEAAAIAAGVANLAPADIRESSSVAA